MAVSKYKSRDIVPVFIHVLDICAFFYAEIALKIAILDHYQQLKGKPLIRHINESILISIGSAVSHITTALKHTAEIYVYNLEYHLQRDQRIVHISEDLYWSMICDPFPDQIDAQDFDHLDYFEMLEQHAQSLMDILGGLSAIFHHGKVDTENLSKNGIDHDEYWLSSDCAPKNMRALAQLQILYQQLHAHQAQMCKYGVTSKLKLNEDDYI